ncbi:hypothetical protein DV735_g5569, partial [Chaetothyriales sp. CBS 134920]
MQVLIPPSHLLEGSLQERVSSAVPLTVRTEDGTAAPDRKTEIDAHKIIKGFVETLENNMFKLDDLYRHQNFEEVKNCATILQDFKGSSSVQALDKHEIFIDRSTDGVAGDQNTCSFRIWMLIWQEWSPVHLSPETTRKELAEAKIIELDEEDDE